MQYTPNDSSDTGSDDFTFELTNADGAVTAGTVELDVSSAPPIVSTDVTTPAPGDRVTVRARGLASNEAVQVHLHSDPILLTTGTAERDGTYTVQVQLPTDAPVGDHHLEVRGAKSGASSIPVTLAAAAITSPNSPATSAWIIAGFVLAATAVVAVRRHSNRTQRDPGASRRAA